MRTYATAQLIGDRSHQCDATVVSTAPSGARAYVLLDGIGSTDEIRHWTRQAARRLARAAAQRGHAEAGLRAVYDRYAAEPERHSPWADLPSACAVVAVHTPGKLTVAWCGDSRAYLLTPTGTLTRLTNDHNLRRVFGGSRNRITTYLGNTDTDDEAKNRYGHPAIESVTRHADNTRLLLTSDGAYEPHEDASHCLTDYLIGELAEAAADFVETAVSRTRTACGPYADNATVLIADLRPEQPQA